MTKRGMFDEIVNSVTNGQRRQAVRQGADLDRDEICELVDYCSTELNNPELALDVAKTFIRYTAV